MKLAADQYCCRCFCIFNIHNASIKSKKDTSKHPRRIHVSGSHPYLNLLRSLPFLPTIRFRHFPTPQRRNHSERTRFLLLPPHLVLHPVQEMKVNGKSSPLILNITLNLFIVSARLITKFGRQNSYDYCLNFAFFEFYLN